MNTRQPTAEDYVVKPHFLDDRWDGPRPSEIDFDALQPPLSQEERLAIRLAPTHSGEDYQIRRLKMAYLNPLVTYNPNRRNCNIEGGKGVRLDGPLTNCYTIEDDGQLYHLTLLNDAPVSLEFQMLKDAVEYIIMAYWRAGIIPKIPVYSPHQLIPDEQPPYRPPNRRPLTEEEKHLREQWERGEIIDVRPNIVPEDIQSQIQQELQKPDVNMSFEYLREAGLFVGLIASKGLKSKIFWDFEGGSGFVVDYHRDRPEGDRARYLNAFAIALSQQQYRITKINDQLITENVIRIGNAFSSNIYFDTLLEASRVIITCYRLLGLIPPEKQEAK